MTSRAFENDPFFEQVADVLGRRQLLLPALLILEAGRPLAFLAGQLLWMAQPVLSLILSRDSVGQVARLCEEPTAVEALIAFLDDQYRLKSADHWKKEELDGSVG